MKKLLTIAALLAIAAVPAQASVFSVTYQDSVNDLFPGVAGNGTLDIVSVEVSNDATDLYFKFTVNGDIVATDWAKYMCIIDRAPGGDTTGNGWNRPIGMPSGADTWIGSWVDGGNGMELYNYSGGWPFPPNYATWLGSPEIGISKTTNTVTLRANLSTMGLSVGDLFLFDCFSSGGGGGDGAIDSLGNPNQQVGDWGEYSEAHPLTYRIKPEPTTLSLLGIGALLMIRRRR